MSANPMLTGRDHPSWHAVERERVASERAALTMSMEERLRMGVQLSAQAFAWFTACQTSIPPRAGSGA